MLSRMAEALYWMTRYLERAGDTARLLDINLLYLLEAEDVILAAPIWHDNVAIKLLVRSSDALSRTRAESAGTHTVEKSSHARLKAHLPNHDWEKRQCPRSQSAHRVGRVPRPRPS